MLELRKEVKYALLTPIQSQEIPKEAVKIIEGLTPKQVIYIVSNLDKLVAIDIETKGNNAAYPHNLIVGVGLADSKSIFYIDRKSAQPGAWDFLFKKIAEYQLQLFGHNIFFDAAFINRDFPRLKFNWTYCTYGLLRQLSTEGWDGQTWGLKDAQIELLGWKETNEGDLNSWLVKSGFYAEDIKKEKKGSHQYPVVNTKGQLRYARPKKAEMWRAPAEILGYYCGVDAASTYILLVNVLLKALTNKLPEVARTQFLSYHKTYLVNTLLLIEQQLYGIKIDEPKLKAYHKELLRRIEEAKQVFLNNPDVAPKVAEFKEAQLEEMRRKEPAKYKKHKLPNEPKKFLKSGKIADSWIKWRKKMDEDTGPEVSKNWLTYVENYSKLEREYEFNLNSAAGLRELLYTKLGYPVTVLTDSELPSTDSSALQSMGQVGKDLQVYKDLVKEEGYVRVCLEKLYKGYLNVQFRSPGTLTGRLAGSGGLNVQQLPKSRGYLECWVPRPGHQWIDCDVNSLEQVVLAELSQDPSLLKLYGPNAKKGNDVYLYNGAQMKGIGEKIRKYYDPDDFTEESIIVAKKECKKERSIAKVITLAASYGAGPDKLLNTLQLSGIDITLDEVKEIYKSYWDIYSGVRSYGRRLEREWEERDGWVYNGIGRPIGIHESKKKDIVNRVVQSTGHDILMMIIEEMERLRQRYIESNKGLIWRPIIIDFHDESIVECREEDTEKVLQIFKEAYAIVNQKLNAGVKIEGEPEVIRTLADAKVE